MRASKPASAKIDAAQHRERDGDDRFVDGVDERAARCRKRERDAAVRPPRDRFEPMPEQDVFPHRGSAAIARGRRWLPPRMSIAFVGRSERDELARRLVVMWLPTEPVDHVERTLRVRGDAVFRNVLQVDVRADVRAQAARDESLDPRGQAHRIELATGGRRPIVRRHVSGRRELTLQRSIHRPEFVVQRLLRIVTTALHDRLLRASRHGGEFVREREPVALRERLHRRVIGVDQFPAVLADLAVAPKRRFGMHAAADAMLPFVHGRAHPAVAQRERGRQARDARTDDRDARRGWRAAIARPAVAGATSGIALAAAAPRRKFPRRNTRAGCPRSRTR